MIEVLEDSAAQLIPQPAALKMAAEYTRRKGAKFKRWMQFTLAEQYCLRGRWDDALAMATDPDHSFDQTIKAWVAFLQGRDGEAVALYEDALSIIRKAERRRKATFQDRAGQFYPLALLRTGDPVQRRKAADYLSMAINRQDPGPYGYFPQLLHYYFAELDGRRLEKKYLSEMAAKAMETEPINVLIAAVMLGWLGMKPATGMNKHLKRQALAARAAGYDWLARESVAALRRLNPDTFPSELADYLDLAPPGAAGPLADAFKPEEPWERALAALDGLVLSHETAAETGKPASESRLTWRMRLYEQYCEIDPYEQRRTARGEWSAGRLVALKRLANESDEIGWLTPQDRKICKIIDSYRSPSSYRHYSSTSYNLDANDALPELAGHPLVFWADQPDAAVEIALGHPELHVEPKEGRLWVSLRPELIEFEKIHVIKESLARVRVIPISPEHRRLAQIVGKGLAVPESARERVLAVIAKIAPLVSVHSQIGAAGEALEEIAADPMPHLLLMPAGTGFRAEIVVRPLGESGAAIAPGHGGTTLIAEVEGRRVHARRDLSRERELAGALEKILAPLANADDADSEIWSITGPENCLEFLAALRELPESTAVVEWPQGGRLVVSRPASPAALSLAVKSDRDWFSLSGNLRADENLTIEMRRLLELLDTAPGRFIPLGEGQFLTLTRELRRRLEDLRALAETHGKGLRVHAAAAPAVAELAGEAGAFKTDKTWRKLLGRIREAQSLEPQLPSTLKTELRDYQHEGFVWLSRLAHWGAGACLADDMGLGKTLQTLAVLLDRAQDGPALVVAPTSVCLNWAAEAERFAPTLNVKLLGGNGEDRRAVVEALGPFDLLVTSYDLMHREEKLMSSRRWRSIVLDEAQAIKNMTTRRSRAAMNIQGDFRMITTGTPIENHLGELWNLFRFLNPGLLGSLERFNRRFAEPIERRQDHNARGRLKRLLQPFILRRMRAQVLEELPPRTEIVMEIETGAEETAFYEALRRVALKRLETSDGPATQRRFQILAEIMRLRRACCNPRLVVPDADVPSAKLEAFAELVDKLREGGHKALVFSQFTDHLAIVREYLDGRGVDYQYLDGTMRASAPPPRFKTAAATCSSSASRPAARASTSRPPIMSSTWTRGGIRQSRTRPPAAPTAWARSSR